MLGCALCAGAAAVRLPMASGLYLACAVGNLFPCFQITPMNRDICKVVSAAASELQQYSFDPHECCLYGVCKYSL